MPGVRSRVLWGSFEGALREGPPRSGHPSQQPRFRRTEISGMKLPRRILAFAPPVAFVMVLSLPVAQQQFGFAAQWTLSGVEEEGPPPAPHTLAGWHSGGLQAEVEHALSQGLGL